MMSEDLEQFVASQVADPLEAFVEAHVQHTSLEAFIEGQVSSEPRNGSGAILGDFSTRQAAGDAMLRMVQKRATSPVDLDVAASPGGGIIIQVAEPGSESGGVIAGKPVLVDGSSRWLYTTTGGFFGDVEAGSWNPALHPRGPDGKFVERPYDIPDFLDDAFDTHTEIPPERIVDAVDIPEGVKVDGFDGPEEVDTSRLPDTPEEAADLVMESIGDEVDNPDVVRERWADSFRGGFQDLPEQDQQDLDQMREAVATAQNQIEDNDQFQDLVESTGVSSDAAVFEPSLATAEGSGPQNWQELAQAERMGGISMVYPNPTGTMNTDPVPPEPGDQVSSTDVATILRHEMAHDMWDEVNSDFRSWFTEEYRDLPDGSITEYADERPEEGFTELVAVATHPDFDPEKYDQQVVDLADEVQERMQDPTTFEAPEPETHDLPGEPASVSDLDVGDQVGVMESNTGETRTGEVIGFVERDDQPDLVEIDTGDGTSTLASDDPDGPRQVFEPEDTQPDLAGDVPEEVDISQAVDSETSDYADHIHIHELSDGSQVFEKQMEPIEDFPYSNPDEHLAEANRSVAAAEVMQMVDSPVPTHRFDRESESLLVEGVDGPELASVDGPVDPELVDDEAYVEVMAASVLTGNRDIHGGNFIVDDDGVPQPVDNGLSATELDDKKWNGMAEGAAGIGSMVGLDVDHEQIQERAKEMAEDLDPEEIRSRLDERGVPEHWQQNLVNNARFVQNVGEPEEDTFEATDLPDNTPEDPEVTAPSDPDVPVERGGVRQIDGTEEGAEIASQIPDMEERFTEELDPDTSAGSPESRIDPETRERAMEQIGRNLDRMRDPEFREMTAGRISHVDGGGNDGNGGHANVVNFPFFDDDAERATFSSLMLGDDAGGSTTSHEMQHTVDNSMGYRWGGESSGGNGGFHEYSTSDPFEATTEHDSAAADAMFKDRDDPDGKPIGLDQWADEARSEVQIDADGRPQPLPSDVIEERFMERNPGASVEERYRKFIEEANRAWFKTQEAYNQEGTQAADSMIKRPYQMTNAGEFTAVFAETMQQDEMMHSFELGNYIEHHPGLVAAWLDLYQPSEDVFEEVRKQARFKGVDI
ncbi:hypothetical protein HHTV1_13 [Haloarcula hispanica tailed virus 1]|uniref:Uncharacterized protein n=1 Tax=Haloarcula hispanica tailed virus 1 TaxID=1273750 RepID=R4T6E8_9CAUD|nr:hypothetical protein M198_gp13 [Haloarcula hispanica tailed virus 1]AGM11269.1 hypothetical protein HHTV1_13 [Haloarcula hispanica tailed virus 1]